MIKAIKAGDTQWLEWVNGSDACKQKKWASIFSVTGAVLIVMSLGGLMTQRVEFIGLLFGGFFFGFMGIAKYNNYRLYRIIQQLSKNEGRSL